MAKRIIGLYQLFTITLIELLLQLLKLNPIILWFRKDTVVQISLTQKRIIIKIIIIVKHKDVGLKEILLNPCVFYTRYLRSNICFQCQCNTCWAVKLCNRLVFCILGTVSPRSQRLLFVIQRFSVTCSKPVHHWNFQCVRAIQLRLLLWGATEKWESQPMSRIWPHNLDWLLTVNFS